MRVFFIIFFIQCVFALIVIFVLKKLLDKELMKSALEKFESCKASPDIKVITVRFALQVNDEFRHRFEYIQKRKFVQATLNFQEDASLKGGVVITLGDIILDFSLSQRLKNFWS